MRLPSFLVREYVATMPGVGAFYLHAPRWRPHSMRAMGFQPEGRGVIHEVPPSAWGAMQALIARTDPRPTYEEVMAVLRRAQREP